MEKGGMHIYMHIYVYRHITVTASHDSMAAAPVRDCSLSDPASAFLLHLCIIH
jgi:hypothetical protein